MGDEEEGTNAKMRNEEESWDDEESQMDKLRG